MVILVEESKIPKRRQNENQRKKAEWKSRKKWIGCRTRERTNKYGLHLEVIEDGHKWKNRI